MPQCPICNAAVWVGQQYCTTCTNPLPQKEEEDYLCSQCGIRMATPQEICQRCKASLTEIAGIPITAPARAWRLPFRIPGIFIGAGLIIAAMLLVFLFHKSPEPPQLTVTPQSQAAPDQTPTAPPSPATESAPSAPKVAVVQKLAVPSATAASSPPAVTTPTPSSPRYFVNIDELSVRDGPDTSAPRIATLNFKDEVELLDTSGGWGKVRDTRRNIVGWSYMRYLEPLAADGSRAVSQHRPSGPKEPESISSKAPKQM
ncbi:MAG: SH3 domain-containing protein [Deltaproteobacteria bacterium]|nr:SH3 domain-containing protein [Deltaproteobacteria bacterium]